MAVTYGKRQENGTSEHTVAQFQRVYDRLRKRSLRQSEQYDETVRRHAIGTCTEAQADAQFEDRIKFYNLRDGGRRIDVAHQAYVRGVADALRELEAE